MRPPRGSTGFAGTASPLDPAGFRALCTAVARELGGRVADVALPGLTPSYVIVRVRERGRGFAVLGHCSAPLVAFAEDGPDTGTRPVFRDEPRWAELIREWSELRVCTVDELVTELSTVDLSELDPVEHQQIRHWRPETLGELVFNCWD